VNLHLQQIDVFVDIQQASNTAHQKITKTKEAAKMEQSILLDKETCLFDETVQFVRNCKHSHSAASHGCGIFWSLPCCWLGYTSSYPQVHTCSLWNASCASNKSFPHGMMTSHKLCECRCFEIQCHSDFACWCFLTSVLSFLNFMAP